MNWILVLAHSVIFGMHQNNPVNSKEEITLIKRVAGNVQQTNSDGFVESLGNRLVEELEERYELITCNANYCSAWFVSS